MGILTNTIANEAIGLIAWKPPVDVAATSNIASLSGLQTIDGVSGVEGLAVLLTAQTLGAQNGSYLMSAGVWKRRDDMNLSSECVVGSSWRVVRGTLAGSRWSLTGPVGSAITLDTTALTIVSDGHLGAVQTTTYTAKLGETVRADPSGGGFTVNLPTAVGAAGRYIAVKNVTTSTNAITIDGNASETIDGSTTLVINTSRGKAIIVADGANWLVLG